MVVAGVRVMLSARIRVTDVGSACFRFRASVWVAMGINSLRQP